MKPVILMYHRVCRPTYDPWGLAVSAENFERQMACVRRRRHAFAMDEFVDLCRHRRLPRDAVAVTFDDGYLDNLTHAKPILAAHGIPATLFLVPPPVDRPPTSFWWDDLAELTLACPRAADEVITVNGAEHRLVWESQDSLHPEDRTWRAWTPAATPRQAGYLAIWNSLRPAPEQERSRAMAWLHERLGSVDTSGHASMSHAEVGELLQGDVFRLGAHSLGHPMLTNVEAQGRRREIAESARRCEQLCGHRVSGFAYPYGVFDADVRADVIACGFSWACAATPAKPGFDLDLFALPRTGIQDWKPDEFVAKITPA